LERERRSTARTPNAGAIADLFEQVGELLPSEKSAEKPVGKLRAIEQRRRPAPGSALACVLVSAGLLAGCSVGPNYHRPNAALPAAWTEAGAGATNTGAQLATWWKTLNDPTLDSLIERAVRTNYDLEIAAARVRAARALRGAAIADFFPTVGASGSLTTARRSANALTTPVTLLDTDTYQAGFDASWELDVFGGRRRALQAATADLQTIEEDRRNVLVSLLAEVARNYVELRGTQRRLVIARENLTAQQEVLSITQLRSDKGLASELDVAQAKALLASTKSQLPSLETAVKQSVHRLSVLLGQPPGALGAELAGDAPIPAAPPEVPAGLPADLLRRRPDVRSSERQLAAATARIGVAAAEFLPKFSLTGAGGFQSLDAGNLISPASKFWSAGPSVRWRLLEYPRLKAQLKAQTAVQEQALAQFNQTVLLALEEVENALVACGKEKERYQSLSDSVEASRRALELANELYAKGLGEFLNVLDAERSLYQAQDALAQSQRTMTQNVIALYKALGGGWETKTN
jgi:multidrug efflux system outer membrane protein